MVVLPRSGLDNMNFLDVSFDLMLAHGGSGAVRFFLGTEDRTGDTGATVDSRVSYRLPVSQA